MSKEITDAKVISLLLEAEKSRKAKNHADEMQYLIKAIELGENQAIVWVKLGKAYREYNLFDSHDVGYPTALANSFNVYVIILNKINEKGHGIYPT